MKDREYHRNYSIDYYHRKKNELIQLLGGQCLKCGSVYNLEFDHIDPTTKLFPISNLLSHAWDVVLVEVKKCQLLCSDCHKKKTAIDGYCHENRPRGENVAGAVLTEEQVQQIKTLRNEGKTLNELMRVFPGIKKSTIYAVISGRSWNHVTI